MIGCVILIILQTIFVQNVYFVRYHSLMYEESEEIGVCVRISVMCEIGKIIFFKVASHE